MFEFFSVGPKIKFKFGIIFFTLLPRTRSVSAVLDDVVNTAGAALIGAPRL